MSALLLKINYMKRISEVDFKNMDADYYSSQSVIKKIKYMTLFLFLLTGLALPLVTVKKGLAGFNELGMIFLIMSFSRFYLLPMLKERSTERWSRDKKYLAKSYLEKKILDFMALSRKENGEYNVSLFLQLIDMNKDEIESIRTSSGLSAEEWANMYDHLVSLHTNKMSLENQNQMQTIQSKSQRTIVKKGRTAVPDLYSLMKNLPQEKIDIIINYLLRVQAEDRGLVDGYATRLCIYYCALCRLGYMDDNISAFSRYLFPTSGKSNESSYRRTLSNTKTAVQNSVNLEEAEEHINKLINS